MSQKVADIELETDAPDWLSGEDAHWLIGKYLEQCERYGGVQSTHFRLACIAAVPLLLTPEILNLLRARFLPESDADWLAEADLLLSPLCQLIDSRLGIYEMDPRVRRDLVSRLTVEEKRVVAQYVLDYATGRDYPFETMRATHYWLSKAILEPDTAAGAIQHKTAQPIFTGWQALHLGQILNWDLLKAENKNPEAYQHFANRLDFVIQLEKHEEEPSSETRHNLTKLLQRPLPSDTAELITELTLPTPPAFMVPTNLIENLLGNPFDPAACRYEGDIWFQRLFDYDLETKQFNWWKRLFVARPGLLAKLRDALNSKQPMLITGPEGTGRTTLLHWLRHSLKEGGLEPVFLSSVEMAKAISVAEGQELFWLGQQLLSNLPKKSQRTHTHLEGLNDSAALGQWINDLSLVLADRTGGWVLIDAGGDNSKSLVQALGNHIFNLAERGLFLVLVTGMDQEKSAFARQIMTTEWWGEDEFKTVISRRLEVASRKLSPIRTLSDLRPDWSEAAFIDKAQSIRQVMAAAAWLLVRDEISDLLKKGNPRQVVTLCQNVLHCYDNAEARQLLQEALRDLGPRDIWNSGEYESAVAHLANSSIQDDQLAEEAQKKKQTAQEVKRAQERAEELEQQEKYDEALIFLSAWQDQLGVGSLIERIQQKQAARQAQIKDYIRQAHEAADKQDFRTTISFYEAALLLDPNNTRIQVELLQTQETLHQWESVRNLIEEAQEDFQKGRWQQCLGKFEEARSKDSEGWFSADLNTDIEAEIRKTIESWWRTVSLVIPTEKWPGLLSERILNWDQIPLSLSSDDEISNMQGELLEACSEYLTRHYTSHLSPLLSKISTPEIDTPLSELEDRLVETVTKWKPVREDRIVSAFMAVANSNAYREVINVLDEIQRLLPVVQAAAEVSLQLDEAIALCEQARKSSDVLPALSQITKLINKREVDSLIDLFLRPRYERLEILRDQLIRRYRFLDKDIQEIERLIAAGRYTEALVMCEKLAALGDERVNQLGIIAKMQSVGDTKG
ncbi:MAG: hypothetical protein IPM39_19455 [Chloroflexi bacterium]|nr:hypothetical protein [Chloroflexota bacterium]